MLSRVADGLYWMSRYLERAEHMCARHGRAAQSHAGTGSENQRPALGAAAGQPGAPRSQGVGDGSVHAGASTRPREQITGSIMSARENARQVREQISSEMWQQVNRLFHEVKRMEAAGFSANQPIDFLGFMRRVRTYFKA